MANTSRKKTLPLAVLAAPALAFGSLTFAAAPAMAVPVDEVEQILNEVDTILVYATEDTPVYRDGEESGTYSEGSALRVGNYDPENAQFIGYSEEERYDMAAFEHASADQYAAEGLTVPTFIEQLEDETDASETVSPEISVSANEAQIGDTVSITIDNMDDVLASHEPDDYQVDVIGDVSSGDSFGIFRNQGFEQIGTEPTYEFTIPEAVETESGEIVVGPDSSFTFRVNIVMSFDDDEVQPETGSNYVTVNVTADDTQDDGDDADAGDEDSANPDNDDENSNEGNEGDAPDEEESPAEPELVEPALSVESNEILVEDFVGNPEEDAGVVHNLTGMAPDTEFEYSVETPANIQPFSSSVFSDENGAAEFSIYGENADNPSVYVGDYTTTVTYEDEEGETQTLSVSFSVVEASDDNGDVGGEEDNDVIPAVDTEEPAETDSDTENDQDEAAPAPAVGGADAQLADTGANGTSLMWIAGGLLALGGAFVIYANRGRLFGRKN